MPINQVTYDNINGGDSSALRSILNPPSKPNPSVEKILSNITAGNKLTIEQNSQALVVASKTSKQIRTIIHEKITVLPPSGAIAGVYSMVDNTEGVWVAPANVTPIGVTDITLTINNDQQKNLNLDAVSGKSINAIRYFTGQGVLIWGHEP